MADRPASRRPSQPRLSVRLPRKAAPLTSLIEEGLRLVVTEKEQDTKRKRVQPRISEASGGPKPGIERTDLSELQEIDDLDCIRRLKNFE